MSLNSAKTIEAMRNGEILAWGHQGPFIEGRTGFASHCDVNLNSFKSLWRKGTIKIATTDGKYYRTYMLTHAKSK